MEKQAISTVCRVRVRRRPMQTPRAVAGAVAELFGPCRRRAFLADRKGDEKAKHVWLQLAQIGDCAVEWILPLLQDDAENTRREIDSPGGRRRALTSRRAIPSRK